MAYQNLQKEQNKLRDKFIKKGVQMIALKQFFFLNKQLLEKMLQLSRM